ncbi:MAG: MATE family efflux transporter [Bacillota bacterium]
MQTAVQRDVVASGELSLDAARARIVQLAWPAVFEQILVTLFGMVDMMMVGGVGPAAIAAIGLTNQPMFLALAAFMALNVGTTALVARFVGAKDIKEANAAIHQSLLITLVLGTIMTAVVYFSAEPLVIFMGAEGDTIRYGVEYIKVIALGILPQTLSMSVTAVLRGAGDTKTPMRFNIIANVVNVCGNYVLINGYLGFPKWGVYGAGLATTIGRVVACIMSLAVIFSGKFILHISLKDKFAPRLDLITRIIKIGAPALIEQLIMRFGMITFTKVVAGLGTLTYAAHQIAMNIVSLSFTPGQGFSMASTSLVGQSLGQKRPDWAERYGWETRRIGMMVAGTMALVFFFFGGNIARLYTTEPDVIRQAAIALKIISTVQLMQSTQFILAGALRGAGDTRWPLISTLVGVAFVRVVLALLFVQVFHWGLIGAWCAMALDQCTRSTFIYFRYKSGKWKTVRV